MNKFKSLLILLIIIFGLQIATTSVLAQYNFDEESGLDSAAENAGYSTADKTSVEQYISQIINIILSVLGVVFLVLIIYGGILWMTAAGNEEKAKKAKELITESIIGLIIVLAAYAITYFVISRLIGASLTDSSVPTPTSIPPPIPQI